MFHPGTSEAQGEHCPTPLLLALAAAEEEDEEEEGGCASWRSDSICPAKGEALPVVCVWDRAVQLGLGEGETEAHTLCKNFINSNDSFSGAPGGN